MDRAEAHQGQRLFLDVASAVLAQRVGTVLDQDRSPASSSPVVDQTPPGDGEHPAAQARLVAAECGEAIEDADEGLAGQVIRLGRTLEPQITGDRRREVAVQDLECPSGAGLCRRQDLRERRSDRQAGTSSRAAAWVVGPVIGRSDRTQVTELPRRDGGFGTERTWSITLRGAVDKSTHAGELRRLLRMRGMSPSLDGPWRPAGPPPGAAAPQGPVELRNRTSRALPWNCRCCRRSGDRLICAIAERWHGVPWQPLPYAGGASV